MSFTGDCCIPSTGTFPSKESTTPFWRTEPHALDNHRSTFELPKSCDVLIVGGGYAGISTAYHILCDSKLRQTSHDLPVVLLEARQACSGATARNGGHLRPSVYGRLPNYIEKFGVDAAVEVADFEFDHVQALATLVEQEQIDCDFTITKSFSVYVDREEAADAKEAYIRLKEAGIASTTINDLEWTDEDQAEQVSGVKGCVGCFEFTAAHLWPYKLMMGLLQRAVESGLNLQTQTPATRIFKSTTEPNKWIISTPRGEITTSKIIFATNGYTAGLLPEYVSKIVPSKGICCRIVYPPDAPRPPLTKTYGLWLPNGSGDYLIPRNDNSLIVGGARSDFFHNLSTWHNRTDDDTLIEPARNYFDNYMQKHFIGWENSGAKVDSIWTGIMGYNSDSLPSVGPIPDREGCFIEAGFEGHGMPVIWLVARGIAEMITTGKKYEEVRIPRIYRTTKERLRRSVNDIISFHKLSSQKEDKPHTTDDLEPDSNKLEKNISDENKGPLVKIYEVQCLGDALG